MKERITIGGVCNLDRKEVKDSWKYRPSEICCPKTYNSCLDTPVEVDVGAIARQITQSDFLCAYKMGSVGWTKVIAKAIAAHILDGKVLRSKEVDDEVG